MKYITKYNQFNEHQHTNYINFKELYSKLEYLLDIIGFKSEYKQYYEANKQPYYLIKIDTNLNSIEGSITRCLVQQLVEEYDDKQIVDAYRQVGSILYPIDSDDVRFTQIVVKVETIPGTEWPELRTEHEYSKVIKEIVNNMNSAIKVQLSMGLKTTVKYIFTMIVNILNSNKYYKKELFLPEEFCVPFYNTIIKYSKPYEMINIIKEEQPFLYDNLSKYFGDKLTSGSKMGEMGF